MLFTLGFIFTMMANKEQEKNVAKRKNKKEQDIMLTKIREDIAKYHLYDPKRLNDPLLRHLSPLKRVAIPYKPGLLNNEYP